MSGLHPKVGSIVEKAEKATAKIGETVQSVVNTAFGAHWATGAARPETLRRTQPDTNRLALTAAAWCRLDPVVDDNQVPETVLRRGDAAVAVYRVPTHAQARLGVTLVTAARFFSVLMAPPRMLTTRLPTPVCRADPAGPLTTRRKEPRRLRLVPRRPGWRPPPKAPRRGPP